MLYKKTNTTIVSTFTIDGVEYDFKNKFNFGLRARDFLF